MASVAGVVGGNLLDRLRKAMETPDEKDRKAKIKRAQQAAENLMPPMPKKQF